MRGAIFGPGAEAFASTTAAEFTKTALPAGMVHAFLSFVPFAEMVLGVLTTLGLFTRWALALGGLLIAALVFGTAMRSDWNTVGVQMIYAITYYLLLVNRGYNRFSLDAALGYRYQVQEKSTVTTRDLLYDSIAPKR